jgi:hypothetical protein
MPVAAVVLRSDAAIVVGDAGVLIAPDLATIDALARLALAARLSGRVTLVRHASTALRALVALAGLADVVCCVD